MFYFFWSIFERVLMCLSVYVCPFLKCLSKLFNLFVSLSIHFSSSVCLKPKLLNVGRAMCIFQLKQKPTPYISFVVSFKFNDV